MEVIIHLLRIAGSRSFYRSNAKIRRSVTDLVLIRRIVMSIERLITVFCTKIQNNDDSGENEKAAKF
jgi:hypothetical protein